MGRSSFFQGHSYYWSHQLFPGWIALISFLVVIIIVIYQRVKGRMFFPREMYLILLAGIITFTTYLSVNGISFYYFLHKLLGFGALRLLSRIINVELLFFGLAAGSCMWLLINKLKIRSGMLFLFILPLLFIDNLVHFDAANTVPKQEMYKRHVSMIEKMKDIPKNKIVSYEPDSSAIADPIHLYQIDAMLAAQSLYLKSINGYSSRAAYRFEEYWWNPHQETRDFWLERFPGSDTLEIVVVK